jgi:S-adenosylmethionine-diacylglycerol 3-amino-3-carboxypropyl transferase
MTAQRAEGTWRKSVFEDVLYAQCWEDPEIDRRAFGIGSDDVVFSITSGGCNALAFLIDDPREVIALDANPYQNCLLDLKMASFRVLSYPEVLEFVGVVSSTQRDALYRRLRPGLAGDSRAYWDGQADKIRRGIIHCGRYEAYMGLLRQCVYRLKGRRLVERFFSAPSRSERALLYRRDWDTPAWRLMTRLLLSRAAMTLLFDKAFFAQLGDSFSFGEHFRGLVERALIEFSPRDNPYLSYILLGRFCRPRALPLYLQPQNFDLVRARLDRVRIITGRCEEYLASRPSSTISKFNFTNIFEWMAADAFENVLRETVRVARDGAVITYRNLLVPRSRPERLGAWIRPDRTLAEALHTMDRSFIYKTYVVERIVKPGPVTTRRSEAAETTLDTRPATENPTGVSREILRRRPRERNEVGKAISVAAAHARREVRAEET